MMLLHQEAPSSAFGFLSVWRSYLLNVAKGKRPATVRLSLSYHKHINDSTSLFMSDSRRKLHYYPVDLRKQYYSVYQPIYYYLRWYDKLIQITIYHVCLAEVILSFDTISRFNIGSGFTLRVNSSLLKLLLGLHALVKFSFWNFPAFVSTRKWNIRYTHTFIAKIRPTFNSCIQQ